MGVKELWRKALGDFRDEELTNIESLPDKNVVVDTSAWVHKLDGIHEVAYARTSEPVYPHVAIRHSIAAKRRALVKLGLNPIFVFDGKSPGNMKKREIARRHKKSISARENYHKAIAEIKTKLGQGGTVSNAERHELFQMRRKMALPTPEDYSSLSQWMKDNGIEHVQAPFEADAQMTELINEGRASAAITEDGDLVVYETTRILSQTKIDTKDPKKSTCQLFELEKLKRGEYNAEIAVGQRSEYLAEISCFLGNDYIGNMPQVGSAKLFANGQYGKKEAIIDSYINRSKTEEQWLMKFKEERGANDPLESWSPDRFIKSRNLIKHYPVFKRDSLGNISLRPLRPLPAEIPFADWGKYIGFDKHPTEYFGCNANYKDYYEMDIVGSTGKKRTEHLGPHYSSLENPDVDTSELLPLWTRLDFTKVPIEAQPAIVLKCFLLNRGVLTTEDDSPAVIRAWAYRAEELEKQVLNPSLAVEPVKWVGFEPLDELTLGDDYDDWVSLHCV